MYDVSIMLVLHAHQFLTVKIHQSDVKTNQAIILQVNEKFHN